MKMQFTPTQFDVIQCKGGWDQITPTLSLKNGVVRDSSNFECNVAGGYTKITGLERFDGRPSPSAASYSVVWFTSYTNIPAVNQTLVNAAGTASGIIAEVENDHLVITKTVGSFAVADVAKVGATVIGTVVDPISLISAEENANDLAAAQEIYRADIQKVPGSGQTIGAFYFNDTVFAMRPNAGGTAIDMYKSSSSGWVAVPFFYEVSFTAGGATAPADGATLTQGAVTAVIKRVVLQTGAWTGTAAGRFIIAAPGGGNFAAGAATIGAVNVILSGIQTVITMAVGGKLEYIRANFTGASSTAKIYACDGINRAFEFDGTTLVPIVTGVSPDKPKHLVEHRNHLCFLIEDNFQCSVPGLPYNHSETGSVNEALGDTGTGFSVIPGSQTTAALAIFLNSCIKILYGTGKTTFQLITYDSGVGAMHYSIQNMAQPIGFDSRGVYNLQASQSYGNFDQARITHNIKNFIEDKYGTFSCSVLDRRKSQYRVFFTDGTGLYITIVNGKWIGSMLVQFPVAVYMAFEDKKNSGEEVSFYCGTDGYVYQLDRGDSFDGANMVHYLTLVYNSAKSPRTYKRWMKASIEFYGTGWAQIDFGYSLGYGRSSILQATPTAYQNSFRQVFFDSGFTFDSGVTFDAQSIEPIDADISGTAENIAITIGGDSRSIAQYTVNSIILHYQQRRIVR